MPFVERGQQGFVKGLYHSQQETPLEYLESTHPDVVAYKNRPTPMPPLAAKLDAALADPTIPGALKGVLQEWRKQF